MARARRTAGPRSGAHLTGYGADGSVLFEMTLPLEDYYEGRTEVLDSSEARRHRGVRRLTGKLYDAKGKLVQEFENHYAEAGGHLRGAVRHEDGTTAKD